MHNGFEHRVNAEARLRAHRNGVSGVKSNGHLDSLLRPHNVGRRQIDLVDYRNDLEAVIDGQVGICEGLRLDALARIHNQQRAFTRSQRPRHLVAEVHVSRGIDEVELICLAIPSLVHHTHGVSFDRDATLALQVHGVENLSLHLTPDNGARQFKKTVAQCRLSVVDVGNNCEIAKEFYVHQR